MIGHSKITLIHPGEEIGRDDYNNPIYGPPIEETVYGEIAPLSTDDLNQPNRDGFEVRYRLILPAKVTIDPDSDIRALGSDLRIVGQAMPILMNGRIHHHELIVERIEG